MSIPAFGAFGTNVMFDANVTSTCVPPTNWIPKIRMPVALKGYGRAGHLPSLVRRDIGVVSGEGAQVGGHVAVPHLSDHCRRDDGLTDERESRHRHAQRASDHYWLAEGDRDVGGSSRREDCGRPDRDARTLAPWHHATASSVDGVEEKRDAHEIPACLTDGSVGCECYIRDGPCHDPSGT